MKISEFFQLPEAEPTVVDRPGPGLAPLKTEGEHYVPPWKSPDGKAWWTIDGGTKRQTFKLRDEV